MKIRTKLRWMSLFIIATCSLAALLAVLRWHVAGNQAAETLQPQANSATEEVAAVPEAANFIRKPASAPATEPPRDSEFQIFARPEDAPSWAIRYGKEFWRRRAAAKSVKVKSSPDAGAIPSSINLGEVIERVSHAFTVGPKGDPPGVETRTYSASLSTAGLNLTPHALGLAPARALNPMTGGVRSGSEVMATIRTEAVRQGNQPMYAAGDQAPWVVVGNTAQRLLNPALDLVEHYETRSQGIELTWVLARPLPGSGPLIIESGVIGVTYAGGTQQGHHFAGSDGLARLRVSNVRAVDATGQGWELAIEPASEPGTLRLVVPEEVLAGAQYPLALDPLIEAEFGLDNPAAPEPGSQYDPAVAAIGTNYLVVWEDFPTFEQATGRISAARISNQGNLIDFVPRTIGFGSAVTLQRSLSGPAVAANGSYLLVVWSRYTGAFAGYDVYGARVGADGTVMDTNGIAICTAPNTQYTPAIAANGSDFLVVWQDFRNLATAPDIYGALVRDGVVQETNGFPISVAHFGQLNPVVAANGHEYVVAWQDFRSANGSDIYGTRVSSDGMVLDTNGIPINVSTNAQSNPSIASLGSDFLVVWQDYRNVATSPDIYGARIGDSGAVFDTNGIPINRATFSQSNPSVAANGETYLVSWLSMSLIGGRTAIFGARVTDGGSILETNGFLVSVVPGAAAPFAAPRVAASGSDFLVVWHDQRNFRTNPDIFGARVTGAGRALDTNGILVSAVVSRESTPAVAFNGTNFLVVWEDYRNATNSGVDIYGARVSPSGSVLDLNALGIARATRNQTFPAVAANGRDFLVVWQDSPISGASHIFGNLVRANGSVLNTNGNFIGQGLFDQLYPSVAANGAGEGSRWLVVWEDHRNQRTNGADIYGARVSSQGVPIESVGIPMSNATNDQRSPAVAAYAGGSNSAAWLVVWQDYRHSTNDADIYGTWITNGIIATNLFPDGFPISTALGNQTFPALAASSPQDFLVAWTDERNPAANGTDIFGARVGLFGGVRDTNGIAICALPRDQSFPAVAFDGDEYVVAWQDRRNDTNFTNLDIYGARVTVGGVVLDANSFAIDAPLFNQQLPAITSGLSNQVLVVNQGFRYGTNRIVGSLLVANSPPVAYSQSVSVNEDTPLSLRLSAFDADGDILSYTLVSAPTNGTLTGIPPNLTYLGVTNYNGPDSLSFIVSDGVFTSAFATVSITVLPVSDAPFAVAKISPLFTIQPNETNLFILSANNSNATVVLDGSQSWDVENDPLQFFWYADGHTNVLATGAVSTHRLAVGRHVVLLVVSDGMASGAAEVDFEIITPAAAVGQVLMLVDEAGLSTKTKQPLIVSLIAAMASFDRGNMIAGANQLAAFHNKVRAQITPFAPEQAARLMAAAQKILDVLSGP